jgi:heptosyltransferase-2
VARGALPHGKVLLVAPNWLGDAVLSLPAIEGSITLYSGSEVTVLARSAVAQVFSVVRPGLRVFEYERGGGIGRPLSLLKLGRRLRRESFQLAVLLPNSLSSAILTWIAGIPERIGYDTDCRGWLLTDRLRDRRKKRGLHQVDYYIQLVQSLGATIKDRIPRLQLQPHLTEGGQYLLAEQGIEQDELLIGIHPGAAYGEAKRWFPARFAAVIDGLQQPGRQILLLGGAGEEELADQIISSTRSPVINLVGKTTIAEVAAIIRRCGLFLSNDSGLMHMAAALGIPQVALFGSSDPQKTAPLNDRAVVIHPEHVSCTPCFRSECPRDLECMDAITVEEVCQAAEALLEAVNGEPNL